MKDGGKNNVIDVKSIQKVEERPEGSEGDKDSFEPVKDGFKTADGTLVNSLFEW